MTVTAAELRRLLAAARHLAGDGGYALGYTLGVRRAHHGEAFSAEAGPHEEWMRTPRGRHATPDLRARRRGYRDGYEGRLPSPDEPAATRRSGEHAAPRASLGLVPVELLARVDAAARAAGVSRRAWLITALEAALVS